MNMKLGVLVHPAACRAWVFKTWREYFRFSSLEEAALDPDQHYIFADFPHGVIPLSPIVTGMYEGGGWHLCVMLSYCYHISTLHYR
jgi:hypothetical protein